MIDNRKSKAHRASIYAGAFCALVSMLALAASLAAPGLGWLIAMLALVLSSLLAFIGGTRYVMLCLAVSVVHLFSIGPLSMLGQPEPGVPRPPISFLVFFVALPVALAATSIFFSARNARRENQ